jgi:hypothetical protein
MILPVVQPEIDVEFEEFMSRYRIADSSFRTLHGRIKPNDSHYIEMGPEFTLSFVVRKPFENPGEYTARYWASCRNKIMYVYTYGDLDNSKLTHTQIQFEVKKIVGIQGPHLILQLLLKQCERHDK